MMALLTRICVISFVLADKLLYSWCNPLSNQQEVPQQSLEIILAIMLFIFTSDLRSWFFFYFDFLDRVPS